MKKRYWFFVAVLIGAIFALEYDVAKRTKNKIEHPQTFASLKAGDAAVENNKVNEPIKTAITFEEKFIGEAQKISSLQSSPEVVDKKLDELAKVMTNAEIQKLLLLMTRADQDGDQRAMAVELLSRNKTPEALQALQDFVVNHQTNESTGWNRQREFESVLRAQAIEGIASYPRKELALSSLNSLSEHVSESFLRDRIARSGEYLRNGKVDPIEKQDENALKKLVE